MFSREKYPVTNDLRYVCPIRIYFAKYSILFKKNGASNYFDTPRILAFSPSCYLNMDIFPVLE